MPDYIGKAYRCGNLLSVLDFVNFLKNMMVRRAPARIHFAS
jgi:hypothetical protein